jgi:hypothetical protein
MTAPGKVKGSGFQLLVRTLNHGLSKMQEWPVLAGFCSENCEQSESVVDP